MNLIGFHKLDEENSYLSNWYPCQFEINHIIFTSVEQYMMFKKACFFKDQSSAAAILKTDDVQVIKQLGRGVKNYNDKDWNGIRQIVVYQGAYAKFSQNEELKTKLLQTSDATLAECSASDKVWGIGLNMLNPKRFNQSSWTGANLLGYTLMMVRDLLKSE